MGIQQAGYGESPNEKFPPINDSFKNKQTNKLYLAQTSFRIGE